MKASDFMDIIIGTGWCQYVSIIDAFRVSSLRLWHLVEKYGRLAKKSKSRKTAADDDEKENAVTKRSTKKTKSKKPVSANSLESAFSSLLIGCLL